MSQHWVFYLLPLLWIISSCIALRYAIPVTRNIYDVWKYSRYPLSLADSNAIRRSLIRSDLQTSIGMVIIPIAFICVGITAFADQSALVVRFIATIVFFIANFSISYTFYMKWRSYKEQEDAYLERRRREDTGYMD